MLPEHLMHDRIHLGADADRFHDLDAQVFHQAAGDDDLADEAHAQTSGSGETYGYHHHVNISRGGVGPEIL